MDTVRSNDDSAHDVLTPLSRLAGGGAIPRVRPEASRPLFMAEQGTNRQPTLFVVGFESRRVKVAVKILLTDTL
jgi:hypothetical protein